MDFALIETVIHWLAGLLAYFTLGILLFGIWRGTMRKAGLTSGWAGSWLRAPWFYLASSILFFVVCYFGWIPLPLTFSPPIRVWILVIGSLLYFPSMSFVLWGRLALGKNYFVSTGFGTQLFADHQLVMSGPFATVRHPMYTGIFFAALGSLFLFSTWTTLLFTLFAPLTSVRARREETALAAKFGEQWQEYCEHVPAYFPKLKRKEK
jgi:protein-S-isoprenylcysteine O-methyltransferase Ste14